MSYAVRNSSDIPRFLSYWKTNISYDLIGIVSRISVLQLGHLSIILLLDRFDAHQKQDWQI